MGKTESPDVGNVESPEARAAAKYVEQKFGFPAGSVSRVNFVLTYYPGCETCDYGAERANISFSANGGYEEREIDCSAGEFIKECVALL